MKGKGNGKGKRKCREKQGKGESKGDEQMSTDEETREHERLDERLWSLEEVGRQRQRIDWVDEHTGDNQTFIFASTNRRLAITGLHMRNSILPTVQADDRLAAAS